MHVHNWAVETHLYLSRDKTPRRVNRPEVVEEVGAYSLDLFCRSITDKANERFRLLQGQGEAVHKYCKKSITGFWRMAKYMSKIEENAAKYNQNNLILVCKINEYQSRIKEKSSQANYLGEEIGRSCRILDRMNTCAEGACTGILKSCEKAMLRTLKKLERADLTSNALGSTFKEKLSLLQSASQYLNDLQKSRLLSDQLIKPRVKDLCWKIEREVERVIPAAVLEQSSEEATILLNESVRISSLHYDSFASERDYQQKLFMIALKIQRCVVALRESSHQGGGILDSGLIDKLANEEIYYNSSIERMYELFSSSHYHYDCSAARAVALLAHKPEGSYLLRTGSYNKLQLSIIKNGIPRHKTVDLLCSGLVAHRRQEVTLNEYLMAQIPGIIPTPVSNQPLEHTVAQCEWNCAGGSLDELLREVKEDESFIIRGAAGTYVLYTRLATGKIQSYTLVVGKSKIIAAKIPNCSGEPALEYAARNLYELLIIMLEIPYNLIYGTTKTCTCIEELYYRQLLPCMFKEDREWCKASRRIHKYLPHSIWADCSGNFYKQIHGSDRITSDGIKVTGSYNKELIGQGTYKNVWALKPFYSGQHVPAVVRAHFIGGVDQEKIDWLEGHLSSLQKRLSNKYLLFPSFVYHDGSVSQVMPAMVGGDLKNAVLKKLFDSIVLLKIVCNAGSGLCALHHKSHFHHDFKPANIMISSCDPRDAKGKLGDFDFLRFIASSSHMLAQDITPIYSDPLSLQLVSRGQWGALLQDQFSFGATLYFVCTGNYLRDDVKDIEGLRALVTESDLELQPAFGKLDKRLQAIIRSCCLGDARTYELPDHIKTLKAVIAEQSLLVGDNIEVSIC